MVSCVVHRLPMPDSVQERLIKLLEAYASYAAALDPRSLKRDLAV